ncbi:multidrug ABC transporter permease/ATP-binding protein [Halolactibacillus alkaliphilus]|uniref:Multidrug ABC transporter permease/ATP-binding protein n=1 Tax=Halolactibacillus alkaliphilus TaxID=442899 RepID=A0A511X0X1_9BACI|nr:ABC transporter ATP-binding protein [Halolactibacillus alkaliphilus]GEN56594.1 multidrug ABC transporter permease/ATP-binding protein [Halolactibacillus alkaliphilus]GGN69689.1 multidrug ABC transporter permease/ATP-binding protein [Halolactibacillus alkaliphilus]SFO76356.1 ATP-binding cassette, subfamily B [Halolactibacillus alkaliphilus]
MFQVFKKLAWFFKDQWLRYLVAILALMFASFLDLIPPRLIGNAIDAIQFNELTRTALSQTLLIYGGLIVLTYAIMFLWDYTLFSGALLLERQIRSKLMRHFLMMSPRFYSKNRTGDLMARATNDLKAIMMTSGFGILTLVDSTVYMSFIILMMGFTVNWTLTFMALIPMPIMALIVYKYGGIIHLRFTDAQEAFSDLNNYTLESIRGVSVTRAFVQEAYDLQRFKEKTHDVFNKNKAVAQMEALFEPTMKILVGISYTIGLGYGAIMVIDNRISIGDLVSFNVYLGMIIWPMFAIGELINVMQRGNASLDRVNHVLKQVSDVQEPLAPVEVKMPLTIQFNDVTFRYPGLKEPQLININLTIQQGETIGIVGKTGAGKTTLFKQLLRQYPAPEGNLLINGVSIEQLSLDRTRQWIGYVPQQHILFSKTVRENLLFGAGKTSDDVIHQMLISTSLKSDIDALSNGLDTLVGESGVTLSGGQKQRLSLARALLMDPEILILDDALSAVDGKTEATIIEHLKEQRQQKTTLIAAHRLSAVMHADQIIVLTDGRITEQGTHETLMQENGWYKEQFMIQQMTEEVATE